MGLTCLDGNAPTLTNVTLESPGEETGHAESPAGAQWWTHSFGDAPKTATAQRFHAPRIHTNTHSTGMRILRMGIFHDRGITRIDLNLPHQNIDQGNEDVPRPHTCMVNKSTM